MKKSTGFSRLFLTVLAALVLPRAAYSNSLTLTAQAVTDGFTLTTFATTNPGQTGCCSGPFGVAVASNGNILVNTGAGTRYTFADMDGQTVGSSLFTRSSALSRALPPRWVETPTARKTVASWNTTPTAR